MCGTLQAATWSRLCKWHRGLASSRLSPAPTTWPATSYRPCITPSTPLPLQVCILALPELSLDLSVVCPGVLHTENGN